MNISHIFLRAYYPLVVATALCVHFVALQLGVMPVLIPSLAASVVLVIVFVSERKIPFLEIWSRARDRVEILLDAASTLIMLPILAFVLEWGLRHSLPAVDLWPESAPFVIKVVLAVLLAEFFFYWTHRMSHEYAILWRFHRVHHEVKRVYWLNSGRFHPVDASLDLLVYFFPLILIGVDQQVFLVFLTLTFVTGALEHANVNFRAGFLNYVFNTAELHRWHHSTTIEISKQNCGKILSVWDVVFGTFYLPKTHEGIDKVGVDP